MDNPQNSLTADKWVRIMCDYDADGVWDRGGGACAADDLPVDANIVTMIRGWQAWYEHNDPSDPHRMTRWVDNAAHAAFGLFIARSVKRALPDWTVIYFDGGKPTKDWQLGQPRDHFEYEIVLNADGNFSP